MPRCSFLRSLVGLLLFSVASFGQSQNATLSGQVTDASGAFIPQAIVTITSVDRQISSSDHTDDSGRYSFASLLPGNYDLKVEAQGFKGYVQRNILLAVSQSARIDASLQVGDAATKVEVTADATQLNLDNGVKQEGIAPGIINKLPLLVSAGTPRNAVQFITFLPGVNTGTGPSAFNSRINGGLKMGDEAVMDGVSMQEGTMSQSGMVSFFDFPTTPDMVSEVRVMTSSYEPEYGTTTGGEIIVTTRSGTNQFHGGGFEYFRNKDLNALQFTNDRGPGDQRPKDNENEWGGFIGGPVKIPFIPAVWGPKHKTYFFFDVELLRSLGGASRALLSIPSEQERTGDFSDLPIPLYDPTTTVNNNGVISRQQFAGNIIPASKQSALALQWMKYLPATTSPGPINNFLAPAVSDGILASTNLYLWKIDHYWGEKDHFFATIWRQINPVNLQCQLPIQLCSSNPADPEDAWVSRFNWDHIFTPTFLNHWAAGYVNRNEGYGSPAGQNPADLPQIPNAASYSASPQASFSGNGVSNYTQWGNNQGLGALNKTTRPSYITNDLVTWVKGSHTVKFGGEFRHLQQVFRVNGNQSGNLSFSGLSTALPGVQSGSPYASLLVGAVDNGSLNVYNIAKYGAEQRAYSLFVGDTWKMTRKFTINYGLRWDQFSPTFETGNHLAFFDFGANPGADNRSGRLAFSGDNWGAASAGFRYPEKLWHGAIAPRIGFAWSPDSQLVIRAGYGMFYTQAFYPGWGGGMNLDGFNPSVNFANSVAGYVPAFYLDSGFPAYSKSTDISSTADNGKSPMYRPTAANHLSYSQQWNLSIDRKIGNSGMASVAYVANRGVHLPSQLQPLSVLNPNLLGMGSALNAVFAPGQASLDGVAAPYAGWAQQLNNAGQCAPSVAQALTPYPQFCGGLIGLNENEGTSNYQAFQAKFEKNLSGGLYVGVNYTFSKLMTDASSTTQATAGYGAIGGVINPYQGYRNWSLSPDDIANTASVLGTYDLPFGTGKKWLNQSGFLNYIVGGWNLATSMKFTSGMPLYFREQTSCGLPSQFVAQCIPGIVSNNVLAQSWGGMNVNRPAYNVNAFEPASNFNGFYLGTGSRVTPIRGSGYKDVNLTIAKQFLITERVNLEFRAEMFNILNNHYFTCDGQAFGDCIPFNNDPSSAAFGAWNGTVSLPRNIQLVGRITF